MPRTARIERCRRPENRQQHRIPQFWMDPCRERRQRLELGGEQLASVTPAGVNSRLLVGERARRRR